jgi:hypothetical protein
MYASRAAFGSTARRLKKRGVTGKPAEFAYTIIDVLT